MRINPASNNQNFKGVYRINASCFRDSNANLQRLNQAYRSGTVDYFCTGDDFFVLTGQDKRDCGILGSIIKY